MTRAVESELWHISASCQIVLPNSFEMFRGGKFPSGVSSCQVCACRAPSRSVISSPISSILSLSLSRLIFWFSLSLSLSLLLSSPPFSAELGASGFSFSKAPPASLFISRPKGNTHSSGVSVRVVFIPLSSLLFEVPGHSGCPFLYMGRSPSDSPRSQDEGYR